MTIPVYVFTGFLESGKTTLIQDTLMDPGFSDGEKTLLISCEEGFVEYRRRVLSDANTILVHIEEEEDLTYSLLKQYQALYEPERVLIEFNGMWSVKKLLEMGMPKDWLIVQILTTVDASTFTSYMNNMRSIFYEQLFASEVIIFNRCSDNTKKTVLRSNVKAINQRAQLIYETVDGEINTLKDDELPFDIHASSLSIRDEDYGLWYMDALDHPDHYDNKEIEIKGMVVRGKDYPENEFIVGRKALVCCADDTQMIGILCKMNHADHLLPNEWVQVKGIAHSCYDEEYQGNLIEIEVKEIKSVEPMEDGFVYFS